LLLPSHCGHAGLLAAEHRVNVWNNDNPDTRISGPGFLAVDYLQIEQEIATTTLALSSSNAYPTQTQKSAVVEDGQLVFNDKGAASKAGIVSSLEGDPDRTKRCD
jgi:hypothetical protein